MAAKNDSERATRYQNPCYFRSRVWFEDDSGWKRGDAGIKGAISEWKQACISLHEIDASGQPVAGGTLNHRRFPVQTDDVAVFYAQVVKQSSRAATDVKDFSRPKMWQNRLSPGVPFSAEKEHGQWIVGPSAPTIEQTKCRLLQSSSDQLETPFGRLSSILSTRASRTRIVATMDQIDHHVQVAGILVRGS